MTGKSLASSVLIVAGTLLLGVVILPSWWASHQTSSERALANRNSFVNGCKSTYTAADADQLCGCMYDQLQIYYGGKFVTVANVTRIQTQGYNQAEANLIKNCWNPPTTTE